MDETRFQEAKKTYDAGDYRSAAKGFLAAAGRGTEGNGSAYHMAGNSLLRLRRHRDAVTVYGHALKDELYDKHGAVRANLASAHNALGEYAEAVEEYQAAIEEPDYTRQYRALQGMASALVEMGKYEDAAVAYRQAALDGDNPDPGKALNNLGLCFMALGRPSDALEAYKAALGFDEYKGKGKALANLGIAFNAMEQHSEAVKAFDKAVQFHGYSLSPQAVEAFNASREALAPEYEKVDGWSTGEMPPVIAPSTDDELLTMDSGWATGELGTITGVGEEASLDSAPQTSSEPIEETDLDAEDSKDVESFFAMTDQEMKDRDRDARRVERDSRRHQRGPWAIVVAVLVVVLLLAGIFGGLYFAGFGYPTQAMTVTGMLDTRAEGGSVDTYWVAVPSADVEKEMAKLPPVKEYEIDQVQRSPRTSNVTIVVTPENGAPLRYEITLAREGVGWKVTGVENDWRSTGGGS